ncbi:Uncharacterised protein [Bordetella pertussis]|nr:Uncharacterised protein [Bordetella pertussis]
MMPTGRLSVSSTATACRWRCSWNSRCTSSLVWRASMTGGASTRSASAVWPGMRVGCVAQAGCSEARAAVGRSVRGSFSGRPRNQPCA